MATDNNTPYIDSDGNVFSSDGPTATITFYGSHFHKAVPVATLVLSLLWVLLFLGFLVTMIVMRSRAAKEDSTRKILRWPVMGLSIVCSILYWGLDSGDRVVHEMELTVSRWYLTISVPTNILSAAARTSLMVCLMWQLSPVLLYHTSSSVKTIKDVLWCFRATVIFIALFDLADTILSIIVYLFKTLTPFFNSMSKRDALRGDPNKPSTIQRQYAGLDGIVTVVYNGAYLCCALAFAVLVINALRSLHKANELDGVRKICLSLIALGIVLRSALDTAWAAVFNLAADIKALDETLNIQLVYTALYGSLSVIVYACILRIAPIAHDSEDQVPYDIAEEQRNWQPPKI